MIFTMPQNLVLEQETQPLEWRKIPLQGRGQIEKKGRNEIFEQQQ